MTDRILPAPPKARFDLAAWIKANVREGDVVHARENATYWTEGTKIVDAPKFTFQGHGATLLAKLTPVNKVWNRLFELAGDTVGVEVFDLKVKGPRAVGSTFDADYEGQAGFAFGVGVRDSILCRCSSAGVWGDHVYIAGAVNTIVCEFDGSAESGRQGISAVHGEDILIYNSKFNGWRSAFNIEVHPGKATLRYTAENCYADWNLRCFTGTGEGEASDITFKNIECASHMKMNAEVYGTGSSGRSGPRHNWVVDGFSGARLDTAPVTRLHYIDGLTVKNFPYPYTTTGSVLV